MKKYLLAISIMVACAGISAQPGKKKAVPAAPSQAQIDKMISEAMGDMSAEEKKQVKEAMKMGKEMQEKGMTGNVASGNVPKIPKKNTRLLSKLPLIHSIQEYESYLRGLLKECRINIDPSLIKEVDGLISKHSQSEALVNLAPVLFLQKKPAAAIYAALSTAAGAPQDVLLQDNLAVILHHTGYPHKAIPILHYIVQQNNYALILNNIGQSYLSLGDTANARKYFMACLAKDPDQSDANCGMGLLLTEEGKISEATPYIIRSLKNGYTETAENMVKKNKIKLKYKDVRQDVPEYFNPQKYKPAPPAYSMDAVEETEAARNEMEQRMMAWKEKLRLVNEAQAAKMDKESMIQMADRTRGFVSNAPFAKKAQMMVNLLGIEYGEALARDDMNRYEQTHKELRASFEKQLNEMYGGDQKYDSEYEVCVKKIEILNAHLPLTAKNHEAYQRATLPDVYEFTNQSLYWWYFLLNKDHYKIYYHEFVSNFFDALHKYDQMQNIYPTPLWITKTCKNVKAPVKEKSDEDSLEIYCPISIKIPVLFGSYKEDCNGFEIEGGELLMLGFQKDYKTGEFSFAFGLGVEARLAVFSAGTKGQMFFRFDKDFSPVDCGLKFETGGDANVAGLNIEEKMVGVMGMTSGIHVDVINPGKTTTIFEMSP